ncbi:MAG: hypothetical protein U1D55_15565 [Phycisphaerae bacterium]
MEGTHYSVAQGTGIVTILSGIANSASRFKFEARTEQFVGGAWVDAGLGDIARIQSIAGDPGTVRIEISGNPQLGRVYGARDVRAIQLPTGQTAGSHIWSMLITGNLGQDGMSDFDTIGTINVAGNLYNGLYSLGGLVDVNIAGDLVGVINVASISNNIVIGRDVLGSITTSSLAGSLTVGRHLLGPASVGVMSGPITINGNKQSSISATICGSLYCNGSGPHIGGMVIQNDYGGELIFNGDLAGLDFFNSNFNGRYRVHGNWGGRVTVGGNLNGTISSIATC